MSKRIHGLEHSAGDVGLVDDGEVLGNCPGCGAELRVAHLKNPITGLLGRALTHSVPFCTYYLESDPDMIEAAVKGRKTN